METKPERPASRRQLRKLKRRLGDLAALLLAMVVMLGILSGMLTAGVLKLSAKIEAAAAAK